jgi:hypothetical protein
MLFGPTLLGSKLQFSRIKTLSPLSIPAVPFSRITFPGKYLQKTIFFFLFLSSNCIIIIGMEQPLFKNKINKKRDLIPLVIEREKSAL